MALEYYKALRIAANLLMSHRLCICCLCAEVMRRGLEWRRPSGCEVLVDGQDSDGKTPSGGTSAAWFLQDGSFVLLGQYALTDVGWIATFEIV